MSSKVRKIDHLNEDDPIPGQTYVCLSFLSPEGIRNCKVRGLKIRGVYATREEADKRAEELRDVDPDFHVFVGEIGKWLPWDPDPNSVKDQNYKEEELQNLMEAYKKNRKHVKELEKERKDELKRNATVDSQKQATINRLRKKLEMKKQKDTPETTESTDKNVKVIEDKIKEQEKVVTDTKEELKRLEENKKEKTENEDETKLEDNLARISELYKEIHKSK